jgi:hypothetical protein
MAGGEGPTPPRHFFLNEAHELATVTPEGGGRTPNFLPVDWVRKASALRTSFDRAAAAPAGSPDPAARAHRFLLTAPATLTKVSESKKARASGGQLPFKPSFGGQQASLLGKLGLDLVAVDNHGTATVHVAASRVPQLQARLSELATAGARERARWIHIGDFQPVDWSRRVDQSWLDTLGGVAPAEAILRFHPVLPRAQVQSVLEAVSAVLGSGEALVRAGRDFSGRYWCLGRLRKQTIRQIAELFPSVQSVHPRLGTPVAGSASRRDGAVTARAPAPMVHAPSLPIVALFDTGVPDVHPHLRPFVAGRYRDPDMAPELGVHEDHGSQVASALVFGHAIFTATPDAGSFPPATCRVFDIVGGWPQRLGEIPDEIWSRAIDAVIATAPGVRVFNLSLGGQRLATLRPRERDEKLAHLQDLDNQAFVRDLVLVVSAGNSVAGVAPSSPYPRHLDDEAWQLGFLASTFNGLVVGAHVDPLAARGIVRELGAPSPFTRVGPGHLGVPVPGFSAPGGDAKEDYSPAGGSGVWVFDKDGNVKDCCGTSYAAPLVAREAAFAVTELARYCPDERPFAATVRAWLTLEARRPTFKGATEKLAKRTLGLGFPSSRGIRAPANDRAVFVWQTVLDAPGRVARVTVPVPISWLQAATRPQVRVVVAWLTPVNAALSETWACRRVSAQLRPSTDVSAPALRTGPGSVGAYPVSDRTFDVGLEKLREANQLPTTDHWALALSYEDLGPPPAGMAFTAHQRVGVVIELQDAGDARVSPQPAIQALALPAMNRLSATAVPVQSPVLVR